MTDGSVKVVLLGDAGVGKSSLALRFVTNEFRPYSESTIGASFMSKSIECDSKTISFKIWDTAGQEKYHSLAPMYYRGAGAAILVFDMCNPATFDTMQNWVDELRSNGPRGIVLAVCANKSDLAEHRQVESEDAEAYAQKVGGFYIETSARDHKNVMELFQEVAKRVPAVVETDATEDGGLDLRYQENSSDGCC